MGMWISLSLFLSVWVVLRMVHMPVMAGLHGPSFVRVEQRPPVAHSSSLFVQSEHPNCSIPVIHHQHVFACLVEGNVAGGRASGVRSPDVCKLAGLGIDLPGIDNAVFGHRLSASVQHISPWMPTRKCRVHAILLGHRKEHQLSIAGVHPEGIETLLGLPSSRSMGQIVKTSVTGNDDELRPPTCRKCRHWCQSRSHRSWEEHTRNRG
mmetsp:Transcript_9710/g.23392  ORF Transcript_9710/g.23392 Transcript_9710/m.23392 type:complete len:208 (+) Transcript_9710:788-1411(+)